ncbi:hypothetical protein FQR65_LT12357 [Abscondita terminalis]|nr:hypothetical protein FQR65_LT12357 [Abscondita terminalis]
MYRGGQEMDSPAELESQFVLRLPEEPARILRDIIHNNNTLKDRFSIRIDDDLRHGEVRVDHYLMNAKVVDLPTVVESLKTIDSKGFYKTADICQMLICKEEDEPLLDEDSPQKKKKDPNKVDKKYLWPHGITPPVKNVRKRRFRKTLKKKYAEAPEIEKEVKRLIRSDNEAWEVINEDDENRVNRGTVVIKKEPVEPNNQNVAEHDIFGGAVSDSEEEDAHLNVMELDENSQNSAEDSHLTDSNSVMHTSMDAKILTEFSSDMFGEMANSPMMDYYQPPTNIPFNPHNLTKTNIETRLDELDAELADLKGRRLQQELEIENLENLALRQRFQDILDRLLQEILEKEQEQYDLQQILKQDTLHM